MVNCSGFFRIAPTGRTVGLLRCSVLFFSITIVNKSVRVDRLNVQVQLRVGLRDIKTPINILRVYGLLENLQTCRNQLKHKKNKSQTRLPQRFCSENLVNYNWNINTQEIRSLRTPQVFFIEIAQLEIGTRHLYADQKKKIYIFFFFYYCIGNI